MTFSNCINSIGLVLDIVGAGLIWKFGLPAEISRTGAIYRVEEGKDEAEKARARFYDRVSWWAFLMLVAGFALQLCSNFIAK